MLRKLFIWLGLWAIPALGFAQTDLTAVRATFAGAVEKVLPAVVNIYAEKRTAVRASVFGDPLLDQLLGLQAPMRQRAAQSLGSGVIVAPGGTVVTNLHVIQGAEKIVAVLADGREFPAQFVGSDEKLDLAVLKLVLPSNQKLPAARFGNSDNLKVGDVVLAVGNPFGLGQSVSLGVVSAVQRTQKNLSQFGQFIQTDATINPGNSGGALIDSTGAVVGINTAIFSRTGGSMGIGFAIPASLVQAVVQGIAQTGQVVRPWLGITGQDIAGDLARNLNLSSGVLLAEVAAGSPAAKAGLRAGDAIIAVGDQEVADMAQLNDRLLTLNNRLGQPIPFEIVRGGHASRVEVVLEALPARRAADRLTIPGRHALSGYVVEELSPALNEELGLPHATRGVAVVGGGGGQASQRLFGLALQPGDVLLQINRQEITTLADVNTALGSGFTRGMSVRFARAGRVFTVVVR